MNNLEKIISRRRDVNVFLEKTRDLKNDLIRRLEMADRVIRTCEKITEDSERIEKMHIRSITGKPISEKKRRKLEKDLLNNRQELESLFSESALKPWSKEGTCH